VGALTLSDGRLCNVVLAGARQNPKGAALVLAGAAGTAPQTVMLADAHNLFHPKQLIDVLCMQERIFGKSNLPPPGDVDGVP